MNMEKVNEKLTPEGFAELYSYLNNENLNKEVKADEIQKALNKKYGFTSGKVTGLIKRAEEQGLILKISRGIYKLNTDYLNEKNVTSNLTITEQINNEIKFTIDKVQNIASRNFNNMDTDTFIKIKDIIARLENIINQNK